MLAIENGIILRRDRICVGLLIRAIRLLPLLLYLPLAHTLALNHLLIQLVVLLLVRLVYVVFLQFQLEAVFVVEGLHGHLFWVLGVHV